MDMLSCGISAAEGLEALAEGAYEALRTQDAPKLDVSWYAQGSPDAADCDLLIMPVGPDALDAAVADIERLRTRSPACCIVVVCAELRPDQIAMLLAAGAFDFVIPPYPDHELRTRVQRAAGMLTHSFVDDASALKLARAHDLIGSSACFLKQLAALPVVANCDASVLILGETGTGKEVFARTIHYLSPRASRPLVAVNCGAIPTELMESELFGCVRGAYTSAHTARSGLVREAEGGTLFLDEVDSLPLSAQTKLLRFLQEKEYRPVGSGTVFHADVRVIAASNHDLAWLVEQGSFRRDLYFRLNVLAMTLPALRDRRDDIPDLARHFIDECCRKARRAAMAVAPSALRALIAHDWPGNVRELHNVAERAVLFCQGPLIEAGDLRIGGELPVGDDVESFRLAKARMVDAFERTYIERLLAVNGGNVTRAASAAQKNRRAFFELMRKHAIVADRFRSVSEPARS